MDGTVQGTVMAVSPVIYNFVTILVMLIVFDKILASRRASKRALVGIALVITLISEGIRFTLPEVLTLQILVAFLVLLAYLRLFLPGTWTTHLFWLTGVLLIGTLLGISAQFIVESVSARSTLTDQSVLLGYMILTCVFYVFACVVIVRSKLRADLASPVAQRVFAIVACVSLFTALIAADNVSHEISINMENVRYLLTIGFCIFGLACVVLYILFSLRLAEQQKRELLTQQVALERAYTRDFADAYTDMITLRHDFHNHLSMLHHLVNKGEIQKITEYLTSMDLTTAQANAIVQTGNDAVDAICSIKVKRARQLGIECVVRAAVSARLPMELADIVSLLGNLFDNAMEACERVIAARPGVDAARPAIFFDLDAVSGQLNLKMQNTALRPVRRRSGSYATTKQGRHHGLGLERIDRIVAASGGRVYRDFTCPPGDIPIGLFTTTITMPLG